MFMMARHGTREYPDPPHQFANALGGYCASCMPSTIRSNLPGSTSSGVVAESEPGSCFDETSSSDFPALDREADDGAFAVDQVSCRPGTDQRNAVSGHQQFGAE